MPDIHARTHYSVRRSPNDDRRDDEADFDLVTGPAPSPGTPDWRVHVGVLFDGAANAQRIADRLNGLPAEHDIEYARKYAYALLAMADCMPVNSASDAHIRALMANASAAIFRLIPEGAKDA